MSAHGTFATAINCIDGRTQEPVIRFLKEHLGVDYVDMITAPGMDGSFRREPTLQASVKHSAGISVEKHHSRAIAVVGHTDCAGNPVSDEEHRSHIQKCVALVQSWKLPVQEVIGLYVNERWEVEEVSRYAGASPRACLPDRQA